MMAILKPNSSLAACLGCMMISFLVLPACSTASDEDIPRVELSTTHPVAWGIEIGDNHISKTLTSSRSKIGSMAHIRLVFENLPPTEEGNHYTLIGGGLNNKGLHGANSTNYEGQGYHFASPEKNQDGNPVRDVGYKDDYTQTVRDSRIEFDVYYEPTNISEWGDRYYPGTEVALTIMRAGTSDRVLHAVGNELNWAVAGVGRGNSAEIIIDMTQAEYTWFMQL